MSKRHVWEVARAAVAETPKLFFSPLAELVGRARAKLAGPVDVPRQSSTGAEVATSCDKAGEDQASEGGEVEKG